MIYLQSQDVLVQQLRRYQSESSLEHLGRSDDPVEPVHSDVDAAPSNREQKKKSKDAKKAFQSVEATETIAAQGSAKTTEPTRTGGSARTTHR